MKMSESIAQLAIALVQFNTKVTKIDKDASNPFFKNKYATLDNIIDEVRPILTSEGIAVMQVPGGDGENVTMKTLLIHESGEWIESDVLIMKPAKNDPQGVGSCITYARRYSLASVLSLNTGEDDDGNKATYPNGNPKEEHKPTPPKEAPTSQAGASTVTPNVTLCSENQKKMLFAKHKASTLVGFERINELIGYTITKVDHIQSKDVNKVIKLLDDNKMVEIPHTYSRAT